MEQKLIVKNEKQCIYFMKETNLSFYLSIPNSKKVGIVLGLFEDVNDEFVKNIPIQSDKALVIPMIQSDILKQANIVGTSSYNYLNQVLSFLINTSHKILTYNHIEVDNQILLNQSSKLEIFNQNFISKYQGRVQLINLIPELAPVPETPVIKEPIIPQETIVQPNVGNVMPTEMPTSIEPKEETNSQKEAHEPGFVSYVLLGVLLAVIALVVLYLVI